jgi:hypothetical protein
MKRGEIDRLKQYLFAGLVGQGEGASSHSIAYPEVYFRAVSGQLTPRRAGLRYAETKVR